MTVTENDDDRTNEIVGATKPPGQQLLGASEEDEVALTWTGSEWAKDREYEQAMQQSGLSVRPIQEWLKKYRQAQIRPAND